MSKQISPINEFRSQLDKMRDQFSAALPPNIAPEQFIRVIITATQNNQKLLQCDRASLFRSCLKCAEDGLVPDGRQATLVYFSTKVDGKYVDVVQYMPMYAGILKRVRNSREVSTVQAHVIFQNDHFVWQQGTDQKLEHKPLFPGDRGAPIGAYAIAYMKDGSTLFDVMDLAQIEKIRTKSRSGKFGPWVEWWDEMAKKSVFKRLAKWLPLDASATDLVDYDNTTDQAIPYTEDTNTDHVQQQTAEHQPQAITKRSKMEALETAGDDRKTELVEAKTSQQDQGGFSEITEDDF